MQRQCIPLLPLQAEHLSFIHLQVSIEPLLGASTQGKETSSNIFLDSDKRLKENKMVQNIF